MEVAKMVISDASNKLSRREIGERLCMILCSFVSAIVGAINFNNSIGCGQYRVDPVATAPGTDICDRGSMETRRCASSRLRSFPPAYVELAEELGPLPGLVSASTRLLCELASLQFSVVHSSVNPVREPASPSRHSTDRACSRQASVRRPDRSGCASRVAVCLRWRRGRVSLPATV